VEPHNTAGALALPPAGTAEKGEGVGGGGHTHRMTEQEEADEGGEQRSEAMHRHHVGVARAGGSAAMAGTPSSTSACVRVCVVVTRTVRARELPSSAE